MNWPSSPVRPAPEFPHLPLPRKRLSGTGWVLLPGKSPEGEIEDNLRWMLRACEAIACAADPHLVPITIAQQRADHRASASKRLLGRTPAHRIGCCARPQLSIGDLHGALESQARGALAVSGTVLTDLLRHRLPTVVIYRDPGGLEGALG